MSVEGLRLIVFDLDFTLWPFWVDTHVAAPFKMRSDGKIVDSQGSEIECYPEVPGILKELDEQGYILAVASRTTELKGARQLMELFKWDKYFHYYEIFPGRKTCHFNNIQKQSGIPFEQMLFFDDEQRNIRDITNLGVTSVLVTDGVNRRTIEEGKQLFQKQKLNK